MHVSSLLVAAGLTRLGLAAYSIKDDYSADNFFNMFTFDTEDDPTHGYVNYVDQGTAESQDLYNVSNGQVMFGVDHANVASGRGRNSIRLTSKAQYTHGLVVLDLAHMPGSICGAWPAFWMTGPNWPNSGEIDIIEGVNAGSENQMTMHTSSGCTLAGSNCQGNTGCPIKPAGANNYGTGFNNANGGVYAMEWTSGSINIWFFPRTGVPSDISSSAPNPSGWGTATASFIGGSDSCDIDSHFINNNIVFDTTFCGDWAGGVWGSDSTCSALAGSCQDYVQNHPEAFAEAYWTVNSLKVYQDNGNAQVGAVFAQQPDPSSASSTPVAVSTPVSSSSSILLASVSTVSPTNVFNVYPNPTTTLASSSSILASVSTVSPTNVFNVYPNPTPPTTTTASAVGNFNYYAPSSTAVVQPSSSAQQQPEGQHVRLQQYPHHQQYQPHTRTRGEAYESSETGTANVSVVARDAKLDGRAILVEEEEKVVVVKAAPKRVSRHLHRHVHHLHHS
ncbi:MAG: hypothetical protein Q9220_000711 [cf. Caloplaca sp. 1 TL-2023]